MLRYRTIDKSTLDLLKDLNYSEVEIRQIEQELNSQPAIAAAFILGSAVTGTMRSDSDIDIALLLLPEIKFSISDKIELAERIAKIFNRQVDLGILDTKNLIYAREAYLKGKAIFTRDVFYRDLFGATALGMYADLRMSRRIIEDAYRTN